MIGNSLLTQVGIAGLAIGIVLTYIQPTIAEIRNRQDEIAQTKEELQKVTTVNQRLNDLVAQVNAIPQSDKLALATYLPDSVDAVRVLKDLSTISQMAGVKVLGLTYDGFTAPISSGEETDKEVKPIPHTFSLTMISSYEQLKQLLALTEQNDYLLEVHSLEVMPTEGGLLNTNLEIVTYSHK